MKLPLTAGLTLLIVLSVAATPSESHAQEKPPTRAKVQSPMVPVEDDPALPRVLLIGDSISIGYTLPTRQALAGKANVHRPPTNCGGTPNIVRHLDKWLGTGRWDVIHFNSGIHDLKRPGGKRAVTPGQYEKNLRIIVQRLKKTGAKLIWSSTTQSPEAVCGAPAEDFVTYNAAARKVMKENGVQVNDLYAFSLPRLPQIQLPVNSHFTPEGSKVLAKQVTLAILTALETINDFSPEE
jgi:hypothetical protein